MYMIKNVYGRSNEWCSETYVTFEEAEEALVRVLGWPEIVFSEKYTVCISSKDEGMVSVHASQEEYDDDFDGAHAPIIIWN